MNLKNYIQNDLFEIKQTLIAFIQQPVANIKKLPDWSWRTLLIAQIIMTAISGILSGIFRKRSVTSILFGFFNVMPLLTLIHRHILSLFLIIHFKFSQKDLFLDPKGVHGRILCQYPVL